MTFWQKNNQVATTGKQDPTIVTYRTTYNKKNPDMHCNPICFTFIHEMYKVVNAIMYNFRGAAFFKIQITPPLPYDMAKKWI